MQENNTVDKPTYKAKEFLLDLIFPKFCFGCQREGFYLCQDCRSLLDISEFCYCLCDFKPLQLPKEQKTGKCPRCQNKKLSGLYFALPYKESNVTKKLIYQFKYPPYIKNLSKTLASLIIEHLLISGKNENSIWTPNGVPAILVPIPLDKSKLKIRGYNQAEELAKELSVILKIPVITDSLLKVKQTRPQMELKKEDREKNLLDAFEIKNPALLQDKKIFLVDDVYTTGSTMEECAKVLRDVGVKSVWGITVAREG